MNGECGRERVEEGEVEKERDLSEEVFDWRECVLLCFLQIANA